MNRLVLLIAIAACSHPKGPPLAPLPPDNPPEEKPKPADPKPKEDGADVPARPAPVGPLDTKIPAAQYAVKLTDPGKGKRLPLKLSAKAGAKQAVEVAIDYALTQKAGSESAADVAPTIVLGGDAQTASVDKDGTATYSFTITKTDARDVPGAKASVDKLRGALATSVGLTFGGTVAPNGSRGETAVHIDKQGALTGQLVELVQLAMPTWPPLPAEPVAVGGKWEVSWPMKLVNQLDVTVTTKYELVSYKDKVWTIKGTTSLAGKDVTTPKGTITNIKGTGASEIAILDGGLYPNHKATLEATFTAGDLEVGVKIGGAMTAK